MELVFAEIEKRSALLAKHPFFERLRLHPEPNIRRAMAFAPTGTFWVMTFQDVIYLNVELTRDPHIRQLLEQHLREDTGHEDWFLDDVRSVFGEDPTSVRWLFSPENRPVRAVSFALAAEVFRIHDDRLRLVLIEVLEAAAGVYFGNIARFLAASGHIGGLKYFAGMHLTAEADHEMHSDAGRGATHSMVIPPELRAEANGIVERMFAALHGLGDALVVQIDARPSSPVAALPQRGA